MSSVNKVLSNLVTSLNLDKRLKEHTLMNLWPTLIGEPFSSRSRPLFIDFEGNMVIAVSDASVAQELSLMKSQVLKRLRVAGKGLSVNINGIRFDLKHFHKTEMQTVIAGESGQVDAYKKYPSKEDLESITLTTEDHAQILALKNRLDGADKDHPAVNDRIIALYEKELRSRKWIEQNVSTLCANCGMPSPILYGPQRLCNTCFFASQVRPRIESGSI
ncbi:MAG: DUF721 domain-containing protein [Leptolyngbya sp.]|nr:DUF721 domain-containing protein [Candidatus Melainabacteria bacterium]